MILINVKFPVKPEHADDWPEISRAFTEATRAEPGNKWFEWYRGVEEPTTYVLIEAFKDDAAEAHVSAPHFKQAQADLPQYLVETPRIVNFQIPGEEWSRLGEMEVK